MAKLGNSNLNCHVTIPEPVAPRSTGIVDDTSKTSTLVSTGYEDAGLVVYYNPENYNEYYGMHSEDYPILPPTSVAKTPKSKKALAKRKYGS